MIRDSYSILINWVDMASIDKDQTTNEIREKFGLVIDGLLNHEYTVTNDVYLEMLLSHLSGKHGEGMKNILLFTISISLYARYFE